MKKIIPFVFLSILLAGCAGFSLKTVSDDLKDAYIVANVTWEDLGKTVTQAQLEQDYIAGGVSASNAHLYASIVSGGKVAFTITKEIAAMLDSVNKAAS